MLALEFSWFWQYVSAMMIGGAATAFLLVVCKSIAAKNPELGQTPHSRNTVSTEQVRSNSPTGTEVRLRIRILTSSKEKFALLLESLHKATDFSLQGEIMAIASELDREGLEEFLLKIVASDPDAGLRILAASELAVHGSSRCIPVLLRTARSDLKGVIWRGDLRSEEDARSYAYRALADIGLRDPDARAELVSVIRDELSAHDDLEDVRIQTLYLLTSDASYLSPFFRRLGSKDPDTRVRGLTAFRRLRLNKAPAEVVHLIHDLSEDVRSWAALVLGDIGDPETVPVLVQTATNGALDRRTRANAIASLGRMRAKGAEAALRALTQLQDEVLNVNAAIALSEITGEVHPLVPKGYRLFQGKQ